MRRDNHRQPSGGSSHPAIQPSPSISDDLSLCVCLSRGVCSTVPHRTRMELALAVALQPGASMQGASSMIIQNLSYLQHATLPPCNVSTIRTPLAKLAFISCCYRGTSPPNRSAIAADRASGASSWLIWLASRAALRPEKENTVNLRAFVLIIKPLIPASCLVCLQCFISILCFNQNQTQTPIRTRIEGSLNDPELNSTGSLTFAGSRHQPREFHNLFSSLLAALLRQAHSSFLLYL
jgi:hypothetical protein